MQWTAPLVLIRDQVSGVRLQVQLGKDAGTEIALLLRRMAAQIDELKRTKVTVTSVVPVAENSDFAWNFA